MSVADHAKWITVSVRKIYGWMLVEREAVASSMNLDEVNISAGDIGCYEGTPLLVELRDEDDVVRDSREMVAQ